MRAGGGMERPAIERVMVITAHPDDSEFGAGGTVAKHAKDGREVTYVIATNGNKGSSDRTMTPERLARIRETEQRNAARVLGVERVEFLGYEDGEREDTRDLRRHVTRQIREIGRASCRERVEIWGGAVSLTKQQEK